MSDPVEQLHTSVFGRISADPYCDDIRIVKGEDGINEADIAKTFATAKPKNGKVGAGIVVDRPYRFVGAPDMPGPEWVVGIPIGIYEHRATNRGKGGTGKHIEEIISRVSGMVHQFLIEHLGTTVVLDRDAVAPVVNDKMLVAEIMATAKLNQRPVPKVSLPKVEGTREAVIIRPGRARALVEGAAVYYTLDGSYPTPGAEGTTLYGYMLLQGGEPIIGDTADPETASFVPPLVVPEGTLVQVNAYLAGHQHSDLGGKQF